MYSALLDKTKTPQTEQLNPRQVKNNAGGFVYQAGDFDQLDRFLIMGVTGNSYYASQKAIATQNLEVLQRCVAQDGLRVVKRVIEISTERRAVKADPALFVLALALKLGDVDTRRAASSAIYQVCRTGTHILHFVAEAEGIKQGWGRAMKRGVGTWFTERDDDALAYQVMKYRQRDDWALSDLLRLAHPKVGTSKLMQHILHPEKDSGIEKIEAARSLAGMKPADAAKVILEHRLPREVVPTEMLNSVEVWEALLEKMPMTALVRNLGKMTSIGLLTPMSDHSQRVIEALGNEKALKKAGVHPISLLVAFSVYQQGRGVKGKLTWEPVSQISGALNNAVQLAMHTATPMGKKQMVAIDVSGSMDVQLPEYASLKLHHVTAVMAAAANIMEPRSTCVGFTTGYNFLDIAGRRWDDLMKVLPKIGSATDLCQPIYAATELAKKGQVVDLIQIYTDNETWAGHKHFDVALDEFRRKHNPDVKIAIVSMVPNNSTVGDPTDKAILQCVGFDAALPQVLAAHVGSEAVLTVEE